MSLLTPSVPTLLLAILTLLSVQTGSASDSGGHLVDVIDPRVWCLHESEAGELWFGTNGAGVFRRTGDRLVQYTTEHGLTGNQVRHLLSDGEGGLLVTANGGVSRFHGTSFVPLEVVKHKGTNGWQLDPADVWLVADVGAGSVCRFDGQTLHQLELPPSRAGGPKKKDSDPAWYDPAGVYQVVKDLRDHVWIGTAGAGLCRYDGKSIDWMYEKRLTTTPSGGEFGIRSIYQDRSGYYWICNTRQKFDIAVEGRDGLLSYTTLQGLPQTATDDDANFTYFPAIAEAGDGALWLACGSDGVLRNNGESVTRYSVGDGAYVLSILIDRTDSVWVGTLPQTVCRTGF